MDENRTMGDLGGETEETATENVLELKHQLKVDGEEIDKIEYDFDALTARICMKHQSTSSSWAFP